MCKFFIFPDWDHFGAVLAGFWSFAFLIVFLSWLSESGFNQHIFEGRGFPICYHEIPFAKVPCGTRSAKVCPMIGNYFLKIGIGFIVCSYKT